MLHLARLTLLTAAAAVPFAMSSQAGAEIVLTVDVTEPSAAVISATGAASLIDDTSSGTPDPATVLGSVSVPPGAVPPADFSTVPFFSVDLSGLGIAVTPGEQLAIRLSQASTDSRYFWYVAQDSEEVKEGTPPSSGLYAGGAWFVGTDLASIPPVDTQLDFGFRTFVEPAPIPEPNSTGLLGMLVLAVYARRRRGA
ncbi:MAG: PEP-CTERM sorting domain-containing protein [Planctomycetota bacterium]